MSLDLYRTLSWLPAPPSDFAARCKLLSAGTDALGAGELGREIKTLANHALNEHQLARLGRTIEAARSKGCRWHHCCRSGSASWATARST